MSSKGLNKERLVAEAVKYIEECNQPVISLHELARRLDVKTPSLYKHIKNTEELKHEVVKCAIDKFVQNQQLAIADLHKDDAVRAYAEAYHSFAMENRGLYQLIMSVPADEDSESKEIVVPLLKTAVNMLSEYDLDEDAIVHWQRVLRAILHGFISAEYMNYFYYYSDIDVTQSRIIAINCFLDGFHQAIGSKEGELKKNEKI